MFAENVMLALVLAPFMMGGSLMALIILKRGFETLEHIASDSVSTLGSIEKTMRPVCKTIWSIISRHFDGKISINTSSIMLSTLVVLAIVAIMEFRDAQPTPSKKKKTE